VWSYFRKELGLKPKNEAIAGKARKSKARIDYNCLCIFSE